MTTEIEKQFFDTFGIAPRACIASCGKCQHYSYDYCLSGYCILDSDYDNCGVAAKEYPQITDRILLELICIWNNACLYLEDSIAPINYQKVTEIILEYFVDIENYRFAISKQEIKHQVCTLFEERQNEEA